MLGKLGLILKWLVLLPVLVAVVLLAVANDHSVPVRLNPFDPTDPVLTFELALYQIGFFLFVLGALIGGLAVWGGQRRYRRRSRERRDEAAAWRARAETSERRQAAARPPSALAGYLPRPRSG